MTKQEAMAAIEKEVAEAELSIARIREEVANNLCTASGQRYAQKEISYRRGVIAGMCAAHFILKQIGEGAEYTPVVEAVR